MKPLAFAVVATTLLLSNAAFANTRICVSVQQKSWYKPVAAPTPAPAPAPAPSAPPPAPMIGPSPEPAPEVRMIAPEAPPYGGPVPQGQTQALGAWGAPPPPPPAPQPARKVRPPANPHEIDPTLHLRRMLEYEVTHEPGFVVVDDRCE